MPAITKVGDKTQGICDLKLPDCPHGGTFTSVSGSSTVFVNGKPVTRIGDTTTCGTCGESGTHSTGSANVFAG